MTTDKIEVIEGNKLIAEFEKVRSFKNVASGIAYSFAEGDFRNKGRKSMVFHPDQLQYHTSWDWLMHVYWKIGSINELSRYPNLRMMRDKHPLFHTVQQFWEQAIDFIKWYNQHSNI